MRLDERWGEQQRKARKRRREEREKREKAQRERRAAKKKAEVTELTKQQLKPSRDRLAADIRKRRAAGQRRAEGPVASKIRARRERERRARMAKHYEETEMDYTDLIEGVVDDLLEVTFPRGSSTPAQRARERERKLSAAKREYRAQAAARKQRTLQRGQRARARNRARLKADDPYRRKIVKKIVSLRKSGNRAKAAAVGRQRRQTRRDVGERI